MSFTVKIGKESHRFITISDGFEDCFGQAARLSETCWRHFHQLALIRRRLMTTEPSIIMRRSGEDRKERGVIND